ncbi:MAG: transcriptional regulator [Microbacterium sp.]|nr:transcriptional regulator [Microbacterium sp.]
MADVTERMLRLLTVLQSGRAFTGNELTGRMQVSPRTLRRDVERLRGYGYPVHTQPGPGGGYRLTAGHRMPPLLLDDDEALATVLALATLAQATPTSAGLGDSADRALAKIAGVFPARLRPRLSALRASLDVEHPSAPDVTAGMLGDIAEAITARQVITFQYTDQYGTTTSRRVQAYRQIHLDARWYVLGWDAGRDDWRVFRIDRIAALHRTTLRHDSRPLPAENALAYLRRGLGEPSSTLQLTISAPLPIVADAFRHETVELHAAADGRTLAALGTESWQRVLPALAYLDAPFEIDSPPETRDAMARFSDRLAAAVAPPAG